MIMKKHILIFVLLLSFHFSLFTFHCYAQTWQWAVDEGSNGSNNEGYAICIDTSGNSYITGGFGAQQSTVNFGSCGSFTAAGMSDIFIAKYDNNGNCVWVKQAGGPAFPAGDVGHDITIDKTGNLFVTGLYTNSATFDTINLPGVTGSNLFIAKYNNNGGIVWAKGCGGDGGGVSTDAFGNIYLTGTGSGSLDGHLLTGGMVVAKFKTDGNCVWAKSIANAGGAKIKTDLIGNSYIIGGFLGTANFEIDTLVSKGYGDIFVAKFNSSGNCLWAKSFGGNGSDVGIAIGFDAFGNIYFTGSCSDTMYLSCDTIKGPFIAKLDAAGNCIWVKQNNTGGGSGIYVDAQGNSYSTGPLVSSTNVGTCTLTGKGVYVVKYDAEGNCVNATQGTSVNFGRSNGIVRDGKGNCYTIGGIYTNTTFGSYTLAVPPNSEEIFVAKLKDSITVVQEQNRMRSSFIIYPNPSDGSYTLKVSPDLLESQIYIYNAMGQEIFQTGLSESNTTIKIPNLTRGVYIVKLQTPNGNTMQQSIVRR